MFEIRLTIELVPRTCWYSNVRSNVSENEWAMLRRTTAAQANYRCEICGGRGDRWAVECHERWEYDDARHVQKLLGLIALCPACHEVKHIGLAGVKGRGEIAVKHLAKVNGWTIEQADAYVGECFDVWKKRSEYNWDLDMSYLQKHNISASQNITAHHRS